MKGDANVMPTGSVPATGTATRLTPLGNRFVLERPVPLMPAGVADAEPWPFDDPSARKSFVPPFTERSGSVSSSDLL
jgi:hypothetical protein